MEFFNPLFAISHPGDLDLTIRIKKKNDKLTVSVLPNGVDGIAPVIITGTPQELDAGFTDAITGPLLQVSGLQVESEAFTESVEKEKADTTPAKKQPKQESKPRQPKEDKQPAGSEAPKEEKPPEAVTTAPLPAPKEPSLFD